MIDYIDHDENGIVEVRCMECNIPVRVRREYKGKSILRTLSNWSETPYGLEENGKSHSMVKLILCKECSGKSIDLTEMMSTMRFAWNKSMKRKKVKKSDRDKYFNTFKNVSIKRRLNKSEVV